MKRSTRTSIERPGVLPGILGVVGLLLLAGGCDRPSPDEVLGSAQSAAFAVAGSNVESGAVRTDGTLEVRFNRAIDARSLGNRSVRVRRKNGRPLRRLKIWAEGETLFVAPAPGRHFPAGRALELRLAGHPSPRALRDARGAPLAEGVALRFRTEKRRRVDLRGPTLMSSRPADRERDVTPGSHVELRFSEPLSRGAVRAGDAVTLRVDGAVVPARLRLSSDLSRLIVRPREPLPPDVTVSLTVERALIDTAGNQAEPATVTFRTEATRLHELQEDFVTTEMADPSGTTSSWGDALTPGFLVARSGRLHWSVAESGRFDRDLGMRPYLRFQIVFPGDAVPLGLVSGVRLTFVADGPGGYVRHARVFAGSTALDAADPSLDANRRASDLRDVGELDEAVELDVDEDGRARLELPLSEPVRLVPGEGLLLEVALESDLGLRLAASLDEGRHALVEDAGPVRLLPAAELLVSGGLPQALSRWYDSGARHPVWESAVIEQLGSDARVEFQAAPAGPGGWPAADEASEWERDLSRLPGLRFVRFRVGFTELGPPAHPNRIDRIVMPYQY